MCAVDVVGYFNLAKSSDFRTAAVGWSYYVTGSFYLLQCDECRNSEWLFAPEKGQYNHAN